MADAAGPGPIAPVHRITIWTAFLGAAAYLAFELKQIADGAPGAFGLRVALALAAVGAIGSAGGSAFGSGIAPEDGRGFGGATSLASLAFSRCGPRYQQRRPAERSVR